MDQSLRFVDNLCQICPGCRLDNRQARLDLPGVPETQKELKRLRLIQQYFAAKY